MKLYKWDEVFCEADCGHVIVLAETRQDAMELVVAHDVAPGQEESAIKLFREYEMDSAGFSSKNFVPDLWKKLWSISPAEFSTSEPIVFVCTGSS